MNELLLVTGAVLSDPKTFGTFLIDAGAGGAGFEDLTGEAGDALAALAGVVRDATGDALAAFGDRFNPTFAIKGALQQTFLGLPLGAPALGGELFLDRGGLYLRVNGSLSELSKLQMEARFPLAAPLIDAALHRGDLRHRRPVRGRRSPAVRWDHRLAARRQRPPDIPTARSELGGDDRR